MFAQGNLKKIINSEKAKLFFENNIKCEIKFNYLVKDIKQINNKVIINDDLECDLLFDCTYNQLNLSDKTNNTNEPKIIKDGRKQYYLVGDKLYKVKKDKSQGELFGRYIDGKIVDGVEDIDEEIITKSKKPVIKKSIIQPINEIQIDEPIVETKKPKKVIKKSIIEQKEEIQIDDPVIETKKLKKVIVSDDDTPIKRKSKKYIKE